MQRVRYIVLYPTRDALPMLGVVQPAGTVSDECPGSHLGETIGQNVNIPVDAIRKSNLLRHPVGGNMSAPQDKTINGQRKLGMSGRRGFAIIGNLAHLPESGDIGGGFRIASHEIVARRDFEHELILRGVSALKPLI